MPKRMAVRSSAISVLGDETQFCRPVAQGVEAFVELHRDQRLAGGVPGGTVISEGTPKVLVMKIRRQASTE